VTSPPPSSASSSARPVSSSATTALPVTRTVTYRANGTAIVLHVGEVVRVLLGSTYWTIRGSSNTAVLAAAGPVEHVAQGSDSSCVPGAGCGSVSQSFVARAAGRAVVSAHRVICGEAMACSPAQQDFTLTVVVS
jgi:hypothetical protein